jgi:hypothetical protein
MEDLQRVQTRSGVTTWTVPPALPKAKPPKYRNRKVTDAEGKVHDSTKQYRRWCDLQLLERSGRISELRRTPVFDLEVKGNLICKYEADASYIEDGALVVEDVKPTFKDDAARQKYARTLAYRYYKLKAALMLACHGITIREV